MTGPPVIAPSPSPSVVLDAAAFHAEDSRKEWRHLTLGLVAMLATLITMGVMQTRRIEQLQAIREEQEQAFLQVLAHLETSRRPASDHALERSYIDRLELAVDVARDQALHSIWLSTGLILLLSIGIAALYYRATMHRIRLHDLAGRQDRRFRALIENSHDVVGTLSPGGIATWISPSVERVLGWRPEEVIGRNNFDLMHPEDVVRLAPRLMVLAPDAIDQAEFRFRHKHGGWVWVEGQVVNKIGDPAIGGIVTNYRDISDRKRGEDVLRRQEERFRMMIENAQEVIAVLDADGGARFGSHSMLSVLGWNPSELPGRATFDLVHPEDREALDRALAELNREPGAVRTLSCRMRHHNGEWRFMEGTGKNLLDNPAVHGIVLWYRDVTDRVASEAALRSSEAALREAQKMEAVGRLAGGVAHDFNNLLTVINGYSELALDTAPGGTLLHGRLQEILKAGQRASDLTQQLLAFSRRQKARVEETDLNALLADTDKLLRRLIGEDITLLTHPGDGLGPVLADPAHLQQIIINLAVNARDAMPRGGTLTLETAAVELPAGRGVRLTVRDTGSGMTPEVQARIFEPFFTTKETGKGTGLGLSIVYGNVTAAGGTITVESALGKGTAFLIDFPVSAAKPVAVEVRQAVTVAGRGHETLLVVEDQPEVRTLAAEILTAHGYTVLEAANGDIAVELVRQRSGALDLVVSDVVMPGLPSADMAAAIRELRPNARWLFMSGYSEHAAIHPLLTSGGLPFLEKPFTPSGLAHKVREVLDGPAAATV